MTTEYYQIVILIFNWFPIFSRYFLRTGFSILTLSGRVKEARERDGGDRVDKGDANGDKIGDDSCDANYRCD